MIKVAVLAMLLCGPFDPPPKLPPKPVHPVIRFLNKDIWKIRALSQPCWTDDTTSFCADARSYDLNNFTITLIFIWLF